MKNSQMLLKFWDKTSKKANTLQNRMLEGGFDAFNEIFERFGRIRNISTEISTNSLPIIRINLISDTFFDLNEIEEEARREGFIIRRIKGEAVRNVNPIFHRNRVPAGFNSSPPTFEYHIEGFISPRPTSIAVPM